MTRFTVNNQPVEYRMDPETPLLWALRDASNLTGTKYGCGHGECGACTVHVDGVATRSCQVAIAALEGSFVTTIEGLSRDRSHVVQQAWAAESVPQCGFCQPGMIMAAAALLERTPNPTDADIDAYFAAHKRNFHAKEAVVVGASNDAHDATGTSGARFTYRRNIEEILAHVADGSLNLKQLITHRYPIADIESVYKLLLSGGGQDHLGVVFTWPE